MENHKKSPFYGTGIIWEGILTILILLAWLLFEIHARGQLIVNGLVNSPLIVVVLGRAVEAAIFIILSYRIFRSGFMFLFYLIAFPRPTEKQEAPSMFTFFENVFFTLAVILVSMPVRPILQDVLVDKIVPEISQAFVRFDAIPSIIMLLIPTIPLIYLIYKNKHGMEQIARFIVVAAVIAGVGILNNKPNYNARVFESRANWITRNWEQQGVDANKALKDAKSDEERAVAYYWLGVSENRQKNYPKAVEYQLKAIEADPNYGAPHSSLSSAYLFLKEYKEAYYHGNKCVELSPDYAWCYYALANYYGVRGDVDRAIENAQQAVRLDPRDEELREMLQYLLDYKREIQ